jgi:hypothetical protein
MRLLAAPVEDTGNEAPLAEPPRVRGAPRLALDDLELDSFTCHGAGV